MRIRFGWYLACVLCTTSSDPPAQAGIEPSSGRGWWPVGQPGGHRTRWYFGSPLDVKQQPASVLRRSSAHPSLSKPEETEHTDKVPFDSVSAEFRPVSSDDERLLSVANGVVQWREVESILLNTLALEVLAE